MTTRRGAMFDLPPSPLPQEEPAKEVVTTQIVNGFWQFLPGRSTVFLERVFFADYPRPLFVGLRPPYPVPLRVVTLTVPKNRAFILKSFEYQVYEQTGIGQGSLLAVDPSRVTTYFGFETQIGNRGLFDYMTNLTGAAGPQGVGPNGPNNGVASFAPAPGQGILYPFSGPVQPVGQNYAAYAVENEKITMTVNVLREPPFDTRIVMARLSGYNVDHRILQSILGRLAT